MEPSKTALVAQGMNNLKHNCLHRDESVNGFRMGKNWNRSKAEQQVRGEVLQLEPDKGQLQVQVEVHRPGLNKVEEPVQVGVQELELNRVGGQVRGDAQAQVQRKAERRGLEWAPQRERELDRV